ncbi:unnamed protein product [Cuscuta campestris]|uniref:BRI1 kinase inhibitor 1 n=1 Tax=Cuscuta campestris TaxID=132261 RepID=A0A484KI92_9ASTE|nr:unnamed protein product [Cuscuta campestris]
MEQHVTMIRDNNANPCRDGGGDRVLRKDEHAPPQVLTPGGSPGNPAAASPASSSSSPAHEFSFSLSLHQSSSSSSAKVPDRTRHPPPAVDLTPADEIFFHGQLLPLQHRHNRRSSHIPSETSVHPLKDSSDAPYSQTDLRRRSTDDRRREEKQKPKSFASMIWPSKWRKGSSEVKEKEKQGKKVKFDMTQMVKRYMRMVSPLLGFRGTKAKGEDDRKSTYSYSGYINPTGGKKGKNKDGNMIRGRSSAPASLRASPANSGVLLPSATSGGAVSSSSESTMEELQSAIQAAIAHCKKSSATSD